jgi:hypothetical protein
MFVFVHPFKLSAPRRADVLRSPFSQTVYPPSHRLCSRIPANGLNHRPSRDFLWEKRTAIHQSPAPTRDEFLSPRHALPRLTIRTNIDDPDVVPQIINALYTTIPPPPVTLHSSSTALPESQRPPAPTLRHAKRPSTNAQRYYSHPEPKRPPRHTPQPF